MIFNLCVLTWQRYGYLQCGGSLYSKKVIFIFPYDMAPGSAHLPGNYVPGFYMKVTPLVLSCSWALLILWSLIPFTTTLLVNSLNLTATMYGAPGVYPWFVAVTPPIFGHNRSGS